MACNCVKRRLAKQVQKNPTPKPVNQGQAGAKRIIRKVIR